jgi:enamine deaminase RidA (YjgF/YER057c/UK114 family)
MTIEGIEADARMSKVVIHGDTVYLAGFTANKALAGGVTEQTAEILSIIDGYLAKAGTDRPSFCAPPSGSPTSAPWTT